METEKTPPVYLKKKKKKSLHIIRNARRTRWLLSPFPQHLLKPEKVPVKPRSSCSQPRRPPSCPPCRPPARPGERRGGAGSGQRPAGPRVGRGLGAGSALCSSPWQNDMKAERCEAGC